MARRCGDRAGACKANAALRGYSAARRYRLQLNPDSATLLRRQTGGTEAVGYRALPAGVVSWCDSVLAGALLPGLAVI